MKESLLSSCEPRRYFRRYEALSAIPHGSFNEKAIADFVEAFGLRGFPSPMDAERLREHMEMVCAPYGTRLDFHDGIIEVVL